jgi:hypothetical protein
MMEGIVEEKGETKTRRGEKKEKHAKPTKGTRR